MVRVNLVQGQLASLAWAWDNARFFQTAALFMYGMLIGRRGLFTEQKADFWLKVLAWSLVAFFPLYGLSGMLPGLHPLAGRTLVAAAHRLVAAQVRLHVHTRLGHHTHILPFKSPCVHVQDLAIRAHEPHELHHSEHHRFGPSSTTGGSDFRPPPRRVWP